MPETTGSGQDGPGFQMLDILVVKYRGEIASVLTPRAGLIQHCKGS